MDKRTLLIIGIILGVAGFLLVLNQTVLDGIIYSTSTVLGKQLNSHFWEIGLTHAGAELILFSFLTLLFYRFYPAYSKQVFYISFAGIIVFFICSVIRYSTNVPLYTPGNDDYWVFQDFINRFSVSKNIGLVLDQFDDTREIFRRSLTLLLFYLHAFSFKTIILFANGCLIGIAALFYRCIQTDNKHRDFLFLVLALLIFQFEHYDAVLRASASTAAVCPVFFTFLSFYFLARPSKINFALALGFALLYVATNTVGFVVLLIGSLVLLQTKRMNHFFIWLIASAATGLLYFYNFSFDPAHHFTNGPSELSFIKIGECFIYSFTFLGGSMQFFYNSTAPLIAGILLWGFFAFLTYKKYYQKNLPVYLLLLFLISISILIPLLRGGEHLQSPISSRYSFFSIMAIVSSILALAELISAERRNKLFPMALTLVLIYHLFAAVFFLPEAVIRKENSISGTQNISEPVKERSLLFHGQ